MGPIQPGWTARFAALPRLRRAVVAGPIAVGCVLATTAVFETVLPVNASTAGFAYLIEVLGIAALGWFYESLAAAVAAAFCFNYFFLPPLYTWAITDPHNWVALFAFIASSLIASRLSSSARMRALEATSRQHEMEMLYELSRSVMLLKPSQSIARHLAGEVLRIYPVRGVGIYDLTRRALHTAGDCGLADVALRLEVAARDRTSETDPRTGTLIRPLILSGKCIGSVVLIGVRAPAESVQALLNLVAMTLENSRSHQIASKAEAVRQSEEFKSTLLDALAHEFKTPLTSIKGATSALLMGGGLDERQREELLTVVDQEADRLNRLVTETTHLARAEAGKLQLQRRRHSAAELIAGALDQMTLGSDGRTVDLSIAEGLPAIHMDLALMQVALRQLLDNAVKYSEPRSPIAIRAQQDGSALEIGVHNWGEPLSPDEQVRIFNKFYRGQNVREHVKGTGMGLTIAREILAAHGGSIRVESSPDRGTQFVLRIPAGAAGEK